GGAGGGAGPARDGRAPPPARRPRTRARAVAGVPAPRPAPGRGLAGDRGAAHTRDAGPDRPRRAGTAAAVGAAHEPGARRARGRARADRRAARGPARGRGARRVRGRAAAALEPALGPARGDRDPAHLGAVPALLGARGRAVHREPPPLPRRRAAHERGGQAGGLLSMRTLGVLLAGGRGTRLGAGIPKALVVCGGRTLLARALATLDTLGDAVVVVAPRGLELPVPPGQRGGA